jgi:hypothetical protein
MNSRVELEINARQARVAELFADPRNNPAWMDDVERIEPISGELGEPGSVYRIVPKRGERIFVATVVKRALPTELELSLDSADVTVMVTGTLVSVSDQKTRLISDEVFTFKGAFGPVIGVLARRAIKRAHRTHMEAFKRFAETHAAA